MEVRRGYKQTEVGVIPRDWDVRKLHSMVRSHNSGIYKSQGLYGHGCNIVGVSDIYGIEKVDGQSFATVPLSSQERTKHTLQCNDLMYGESSLVREGIARTVYVTERGAGTAFAWHTRRYSIDQRTVLSPYLYYYLQSRPARAHMISQSIQTALTGINTVAYFACPIIVPPFAEQQAIAEALSDANALIASLEKLIAKKRHLKQGAMQELLTGKKRLPGFSGEWEVKRLDAVAAIRSGGTPSTNQAEFWDGDVLWCIPTDITALNGFKYLTQTSRTISTQGLKYSSAELIPAYSVLMTSRATIGECAINAVPVATNQGFKNFVPFQATDGEFLYYLLQTKKQDFISLCGGSTFLEIGKTQLAAFEIELPKEKPEQTAIAGILSDMDTEIAALEGKLTKTRQLKQGMMHNLLTGKIRLV